MVTTIGMNVVSAGAIAAVWIELTGNNETKVTVVTKRKMATNIATGLTEATFHDRFTEAMQFVKLGKSIPIERPRGQAK